MSEFFKKLTVLEKTDDTQKLAEASFSEIFVQRYTFKLLIFFTLLLASKQHFGSPIHCQVPAESPKSWVEYYHDYCYYQEKYRIIGDGKKNQNENNLQVPVARFTAKTTMNVTNILSEWRVSYYQWIPYVIFIQAVISLVPSLLWLFIGQKIGNGSDIRAVIMEAKRIPQMKPDERKLCIGNMVKFILEILHNKNGHGNNLTMAIYTMIKWTTFLVILLQMHFFATLVGNGNALWGFDVLFHVITASGELYSGYFPRIVQCEVHKFELINEHNQLMMCLLTQNFIAEKVLVFLYFWFLIIGVVSLWTALRYTLLLSCNSYRRFVTSALLPTKEVMSTKAIRDVVDVPIVCAPTTQLMDYFIDFLGCDGSLIIMLVNELSDPLTGFELAQDLWNKSVQPIEVVDNILNHRACAGSEEANEESGDVPEDRKPLMDSSSDTLPGFKLEDHVVESDEQNPLDEPDNFRE